MRARPVRRREPVPFYSGQHREEGSAVDLKEFIQTAVTQIVEGVVAAQTAVARRGAAVNPTFDLNGGGSPPLVGFTAAGARVSNITFDVAVTALDGIGAEGGAQLRVAGVVSPGVGTDANGNAGHVTRVQFSLPICLPEDRASRSPATHLDSRFLQPVENGDSTWMPAG
jgi:hypothetical protein